MILSCLCGRRFRSPEESSSKSRTCPQCGGPLAPEQDALAPAVDLNVLIEQMKVLRDELVTRDRALRRAQAESSVLRAELAQLRSQQTSRKLRPESSREPLRLDLPSDRVPLFTSRDP
jgi:hypothetical protein